jgi:TonB family protein
MKNFLLSVVAVAAAGTPAFAQAPPAGAAEEKLSQQQIKATVDSHVADLKACMKEHGAATGRVVLVFGVLPDGKTSDVKIKEASSNGGLDKCIAAGFRRWVFPARKAGPFQGVEYPLQFAAPPPPPKENPEEQKQLEGVVQSHVGDVRGCYEQGLQENEELKGTVTTQIVIAPAGNVSQAKIVKSELQSDKVARCITDAIKKWQFPKHTGTADVIITYPFVLKAENNQ